MISFNYPIYLIDTCTKYKFISLFKVWDASAKYTTGVLRGNVFQMGDWDECITIQGPYKTQYCLASIIIDMPEPTSSRDPVSIEYSPYETVLNKIYVSCSKRLLIIIYVYSKGTEVKINLDKFLCNRNLKKFRYKVVMLSKWVFVLQPLVLQGIWNPF